MSNKIKIPKLEDTLLVGFNRENPNSDPVLIIGRRRMNQSTEIVNAFQGEEAMKLYEKLTTVNIMKDVKNE